MACSRVSHVFDKGKEKGALVVEREIRDAANEALLATIEQTKFCRADGGFAEWDEPPELLPRAPSSPITGFEE
jgi:hypothetical protein